MNDKLLLKGNKVGYLNYKKRRREHNSREMVKLKRA